MAYNATAEEIRYELNIGFDMVLLNWFAYSFEILCLFSSIIIMIVYLAISKMNRRFHPMLRWQMSAGFVFNRIFSILMNTMCIGMLVNSFLRIYMAPVRLFLGRGYNIPWIQRVDYICKIGQLVAILQIDVTAFLISIERLIATKFIRRYENMFSKFHHKVILNLVVVSSIYVSSFYMFIGRGDVYVEREQTTLMIVSYLMMASNVGGVVLLRITQIMSKRHLTSPDRALSTSYQCKENLRVVKLISPVYVLLFFTRFCQFGFRMYAYYVAFDLGAFLMRLLAHMYNLSLAVGVFLTPFLLIVLQPPLLGMFYKRHVRRLSYVEADHNKNTVTYFEDLKKMWGK